MRNSRALFASPYSMERFSRHSSGRAGHRSHDGRYGDAGAWIVFAIGLLLMLAAAIAHADEAGVARRTERFNGTLPARSRLRVMNVSGDVVATAGREFSAVCNTTVTASTTKRAEEILSKTRTVQQRDGNELTLESRWPESDEDGRGSHRSYWTSRDGGNNRCHDCRITMRYEIVVPPGVVAVLRTVNGDVRIQDVDGELDLQSVNGNVDVRGARRAVHAQTVNGRVEVAAASVAPGAGMDLKTVSGSIVLTLPKDARFDLSAATMNGTIGSTFPLAPREDAAMDAAEDARRLPRTPRAPRAPRPPRRVVVQRDGEDVVVDVPELERELASEMKEVDTEIRESLRDADRELSRMKVLMPGGQYRGSIGQGGPAVRLSTLNGKILVLAAGTSEGDAKSIVSRRSFVVPMPKVDVRVETPSVRVRVPEVRVRLPRDRGRDRDRPVAEVDLPEEGSVVRGDVAGDFLAPAGAGTYRIGRISGKVLILTHSGEIHVGSAGSGADLKTYGGDIQVGPGPVQGDLKAQTLAGDIRAGAVSGSVSADTSGGDVRIDRIAGSADVRTGAGDVVLPAVGGAVKVETGGGEVRIGVTARDLKGGISIRNAGGDVTLTLPSNFRGDLDLTATDADPDERAIRSDFPELVVTRRPGSQQGTGSLNGGGPKVTVRTSSGSIRIRRAPAAGS